MGDREGLERALKQARPDWIFHLAAYGAYPQQHDFSRMVMTNFHGTGHLLAAAESAGFDALVHAGTSSEYGYKDHAPSEEEIVEPNSPYAVSKSAATELCRMTARRTGLPIRTLRLYSAYGPYEEPRWGTMQARSWDTDVWVSDPRRIKSRLGWEPRSTLEDGLARTIDWFRSNEGVAHHYRAEPAGAT